MADVEDNIISFTSSEEEDEEAYLAGLEAEAFQEQETHHAKASNGLFSDVKAIQERIRQKNVETQITQYEHRLDQVRSVIAQLEDQQEQSQAEVQRLESGLGRLDVALSELDEDSSSAARLKVKQLQDERSTIAASLQDELAEQNQAHAELGKAYEDCDRVAADLNQFRNVQQDLHEKTKYSQRADVILGGMRDAREHQAAMRATNRRKRSLKSHAATQDFQAAIEASQVAAKEGHARVVGKLKEKEAKMAERNQQVLQEREAELDKRRQAILSLKVNRDRVAEEDRRKAALKQKAASQRQAEREREHSELLEQGLNPELVFRQREQEQKRAQQEKELQRTRRHQEDQLQTQLKQEAATMRMTQLAHAESQKEKAMATTIKSMRKTNRAQQPKPQTATKKAAPKAKQLVQLPISTPPEDPPTPDLASRLESRAQTAGAAMSVLPDVSEDPALHLDFGDESDDEDHGELASATASLALLGDVAQTSYVAAAMFADDEFQGLWQDKADADDASAEPDKYSRLSKLEKQRMEDALVRQRDNIAKPQVVAGKQFKGQPFVANPDVIEFLDFDVSKTYRTSISMTNVSYGVNSFRMQEAATSAISYEYRPAGHLSAGLSAPVVVVFKPQANLDVDTEMVLLTQTGPMSIPIRCRRKRCEVSVSEQDLKLGSIWLGERKTQTLQITNYGALATRFTLCELDGSPPPQLSTDGELPPVLSIDGTTEGFLAPRTAVVVTVCYTPREPGQLRRQFLLQLSDKELDDITISVSADCSDIPVFFATKEIDLRICCEGHEYQALAEVRNTNPTSSNKAYFSLPAAAKSSFELKPTSSVLQPNSSLSLSLVLKPHSDTLLHLKDYAESDTGRVTIPITMQVEGQALGSELTLTAHITPSNIELSTSSIDFGSVSVYETAIQTIELTNNSALAQAFAFKKLPEHISVQPGDGLGTLLPFETLKLDVLFSPPRHPHDDDDRAFKSDLLLEGEFAIESLKLSCSGVGCVSPLRFSTSQIQFAATSLGDRRCQKVTMTNISVDALEYELAVPIHLGVSVSPVTGTLKPGACEQVWVQFAPQKTQYMRPEPETVPDKAPVVSSAPAASHVEGEESNEAVRDLSEDEHAEDNEHPVVEEVAEVAAVAVAKVVDAQPLALPVFNRAQLSCYCLRANQDQPSSKDISTISLELPVTEPALSFEVDDCTMAETMHDFGLVALGQQAAFSITISNTSNRSMPLRCSILDSAGAFRPSKALRPMLAGEKQVLRLLFTPELAMPFQEDFDIVCEEQTLRLRLCGTGVLPTAVIECPPTPLMAKAAAALHAPSLQQAAVSFEDAIVNTTQTRAITLKNESNVALEVVSNFASETVVVDQPLVCYNNFKELPEQRRTAGSVDAPNWGTVPAFSVVPAQFTLPPKGEQILQLYFQPDHASAHYRDALFVQYSSSKKPLQVDLRGRAWSPGTFLFGTDVVHAAHDTNPLATPVSLESPVESSQEQRSLHLLYPLDVQSIITGGVASDLFFGVVNPAEGKKVAGGEATLDALPPTATTAGFVLEPTSKLTLESGSARPCRLSFQPPAGAVVAAGMVFETALRAVVKSSGKTVVYVINASVRVVDTADDSTKSN